MKKIIFDLDNTLLFLSDEWLNVYDKFREKYSLNVSSIEMFKTIGTIEVNNKDKIINHDFFINYINENLSQNYDENMGKEILEEYAKIPLLKVDIVEDVLKYLSSKYEIIAYTNWFTDNQIYRLKINNLDKYFTKIYGWDILPVKPSKKGLEEIVNGSDINDYIFIGDNIDADMVIPDEMGMKTIFYNNKGIVQDKYKEVKNIEELKNIL
ncbi:MAG: HAD family hydrolase [Bacilli bacterium]|nr:HAD family hydrolase [Bacilli bacterium]